MAAQLLAPVPTWQRQVLWAPVNDVGSEQAIATRRPWSPRCFAKLPLTERKVWLVN